MEMIAEREAKAEEERLRKKAAADAAFKAVVEETEKLSNEEDELRQLRQALCFTLSCFNFLNQVGGSVLSIAEVLHV